MLSISDASDLAQAAYAPTAIAILSLVVIGGFLNLREIFSRLFRKFATTFAAYPDEPSESADTKSIEGQERLLRVSVFLFLVLAWPPFFHSLANLSPLNVSYSPSDFYFISDLNVLAHIACARPVALNLIGAAGFIDASATLSEGDRAEAVSSQVQRAFAMVHIARSVLVLFVASLVVSIISPRLRDFSTSLILLSVLLVSYTGISGFSAVKTGLAYEASQKLSVVYANITEEAADNISAECIEGFLEEVDGRAKPGAWISVGWPNFGALLPLPN